MKKIFMMLFVAASVQASSLRVLLVDGTGPTTGLGHSSLDELSWVQSGHTGTPQRVSVFNSGGFADEAALGSNLEWSGTTIRVVDSPVFSGDVVAGGASLTNVHARVTGVETGKLDKTDAEYTNTVVLADAALPKTGGAENPLTGDLHVQSSIVGNYYSIVSPDNDNAAWLADEFLNPTIGWAQGETFIFVNSPQSPADQYSVLTVLTNAAPTLHNREGTGIWQSEGTATTGNQIVNYQTMTNYVANPATGITADSYAITGNRLAIGSYTIVGNVTNLYIPYTTYSQAYDLGGATNDLTIIDTPPDAGYESHVKVRFQNYTNRAVSYTNRINWINTEPATDYATVTFIWDTVIDDNGTNVNAAAINTTVTQ